VCEQKIANAHYLANISRWLLVKGRTEEARKVVARYAKSKGKELTDETWKLILKAETEEVRYAPVGIFLDLCMIKLALSTLYGREY